MKFKLDADYSHLRDHYPVLSSLLVVQGHWLRMDNKTQHLHGYLIVNVEELKVFFDVGRKVFNFDLDKSDLFEKLLVDWLIMAD
jgi:hypothetical protein